MSVIDLAQARAARHKVITGEALARHLEPLLDEGEEIPAEHFSGMTPARARALGWALILAADEIDPEDLYAAGAE